MALGPDIAFETSRAQGYDKATHCHNSNTHILVFLTPGEVHDVVVECESIGKMDLHCFVSTPTHRLLLFGFAHHRVISLSHHCSLHLQPAVALQRYPSHPDLTCRSRPPARCGGSALS